MVQITGHAIPNLISAALTRLGLICALILTTGLVPTSEIDAADFSASPDDAFCRISSDARTELRTALHVARARPAPTSPPDAPRAIGLEPRAPRPEAPANEHRDCLSRRSRAPGLVAPRLR